MNILEKLGPGIVDPLLISLREDKGSEIPCPAESFRCFDCVDAATRLVVLSPNVDTFDGALLGIGKLLFQLNAGILGVLLHFLHRIVEVDVPDIRYDDTSQELTDYFISNLLCLRRKRITMVKNVSNRIIANESPMSSDWLIAHSNRNLCRTMLPNVPPHRWRCHYLVSGSPRREEAGTPRNNDCIHLPLLHR